MRVSVFWMLGVLGLVALAGCVRGTATTMGNIDQSLITAAQERANDGILRAEDVRGGYANATVGDQVGSLQPRTIARVGSGNIGDYLNGSAALPATMPAATRADLRRIYSARGNQLIWSSGGSFNAKARQLFTAMMGATVDGLLPRDYLIGERALPSSVEAGSAAAAQIDIELTAGLLRYIRDAREGRYSGRSSLDAVPLAQTVMAAGSIDRGLGAAVNQGDIYMRLRERGKSQVQFLTAAQFDAYRVTMESLRAEPESLAGSGRYIVSNIAAQEVFAMRDGRIELAMNMVVGRPSRETPVRDDGITSVKFSPDWTAPRSIVAADLVPQAPEIFELMGIEVRRGGQAIDPATIDWTRSNIVNQYDFVQPPGPLNVLGGVRFTLQNSAAIFMHDSPDRVLFNKAHRIYSSGCLRLEKSAELAQWLLADQDPSWTLARVRAAMAQGEIDIVRLNQRVPIRTLYLEAWPSHQGGLRVVPDIYGKNAALRQRMGISTQTSGDPRDLAQFQTSIF